MWRGVSGVFRSLERGQRVVSMRGRQRVVSYIMPPRGDGMGAGGRQQGECHQEDSLTLALCCEGTTRTRVAGRRGKMEPLNGVKEISPLYPTLTFFKFMSFNFALQEIPCLT